MAIRTVIIDDEPGIISSLEQMLKYECPQVEIVASAQNLRRGKEILLSKAVDLLFLDVKLGNNNGFNLLRQMNKIDFQIIFITAYNEYAVQAFRFSALDFLLKPIDPDQLVESIRKAEQALYSENLELRIQNLLYNQRHINEDRTMVLKTMEAYHIIKIRDIIHCEAQGNYTVFHFKNTASILVSQTLKKYDEMLKTYGFFRCHQSHLVNLDCIIRFDKRNGGSLCLEDESSLPVSPKKKEQLFKVLSTI